MILLRIALILATVAVFVLAWRLNKRRECPACSLKISARARICPKCGADIEVLDARTPRSRIKGGGKGW